MMTPEHLDALSALFDGERVDPALLAEALAQPDAGRLLADFASLRVLAQADLDRPTDAFYASMATVLRGRGLRSLWQRVVRPALAASLLLGAGLTGFWLRPMLDTSKSTTIVRPDTTGPQAARINVTSAPALPSSRSPAVSAPRQVDRGGPPAASLRLRFAQWQARNPGTVNPPE